MSDITDDPYDLDNMIGLISGSLTHIIKKIKETGDNGKEIIKDIKEIA
jgi:hypothetical protein